MNNARSLLHRLRQWKKNLTLSEPLIRIKISKSALLHNLQALQNVAPQWSIIPVLKSNAYGHGLVLVAGTLEHQPNVSFFAVDSYFEATVLRRAGIAKPILILGHTPTVTIKRNRLQRVSFTIASLHQIDECIAGKVSADIHIKFDTGMHRQGILHTDLEKVEAFLETQLPFRVTGVFSHFADAEVAQSSLTRIQIERWNTIARRLKKTVPSISHYHIANSAGFTYAKDILANAGRSGIALYGINPGNLPVSLRPALSMESIITEVREITVGDTVGYNATFTARRPTRVGTVPVGYSEGIDRRLSNKGSFTVDGKAVPIIGRVSMNISSSDLSDIKTVQPGTPVILVSNNPADQNCVEKIAMMCETIPYEILIHMPAHLHRELVS